MLLNRLERVEPLFKFRLARRRNLPEVVAVDEKLRVRFQLRDSLLECSRRLKNGTAPAIRAVFEIYIDRLQAVPPFQVVARPRFRDEAVAAEIVGIFPAAKFDDAIVLP